VRLNPLLLVATLLFGVPGTIFAARAFATYHDATEAFTQAELLYVRDSFRWEDPEFDRGTALFRIENGSQFTITVESLMLSLRFDDEFAGAEYERWQAIRIAPGETEEFRMNFSVTANSIQERGGSALLSFAGQLRITFAEFEEPLAYRFRGDIGVVPYEGG
jgi:hypothetical protein